MPLYVNKTNFEICIFNMIVLRRMKYEEERLLFYFRSVSLYHIHTKIFKQKYTVSPIMAEPQTLTRIR